MIPSNYLTEYWTVFEEEKKLLLKRSLQTRLGMAILLKFFQEKNRFPNRPEEVSQKVVAYVSEQIGVSITAWQEFDWTSRTIKRIRAEIRDWLGFRESHHTDLLELKRWLIEDVINNEHRAEQLETDYRNYKASFLNSPKHPPLELITFLRPNSSFFSSSLLLKLLFLSFF